MTKWIEPPSYLLREKTYETNSEVYHSDRTKTKRKGYLQLDLVRRSKTETNIDHLILDSLSDVLSGKVIDSLLVLCQRMGV